MNDVLGDGLSEVVFIDSAGSDLSVVRAARVSYNNDTGVFDDIKDTKLIKYLIKNQHGSPLEHNMITYRIKAPLFVVQEMLRHRVGTSFNQESARYTKLKAEFYVPVLFRQQHPTNKQASIGQMPESQASIARMHYIDSCKNSFKEYEYLLGLGVPREQARGVLPHSTYTNLYITFNLRSLLHFLELRLSSLAQFEIRQYAQAFLSIAEEHFPVTIQAWMEVEKEKVF